MSDGYTAVDAEKGQPPRKGALETKGRMDAPRQAQETRKGIHLIQGSLKSLIR